MDFRDAHQDKIQKRFSQGNILEDFVADYFTKRGWTVDRARGYTPAYDMRVTRGRASLLIEVKHDVMSDQTGNYALEEKALTHSQSDILIIGNPQKLYYLPIQTTLSLLNSYPKIQAGDLTNNPTALVPKQILINNAKRL